MPWPLNTWVPLHFTFSSWLLCSGMWSNHDFRALYTTPGMLPFSRFSHTVCSLTFAFRLHGLCLSGKLSCGGERGWHWLLNIVRSTVRGRGAKAPWVSQLASGGSWGRCEGTRHEVAAFTTFFTGISVWSRISFRVVATPLNSTSPQTTRVFQKHPRITQNIITWDYCLRKMQIGKLRLKTHVNILIIFT